MSHCCELDLKQETFLPVQKSPLPSFLEEHQLDVLYLHATVNGEKIVNIWFTTLIRVKCLKIKGLTNLSAMNPQRLSGHVS